MTRLIAFASQKGGVGKTTAAINIACGWARLAGPDRVLLVDLDPQANATAVLLGVPLAAGPRQPGSATVKEVLLEEASAADAILSTDLPAVRLKDGIVLAESRLHVLPSHLELAMVEPLLNSRFMGEYRLKKGLASIVNDYDVILVDCPPSLGSLTLNALLFCEEVIVPIDPGLFPLIGLALLSRTVGQAQEINDKLRISGILPTMMDRTNVSADTMAQLEQHYNDLLLPMIPRRTIIGEAITTSQDVFSYSPTSDGATAYAALLSALVTTEVQRD
jgi:chromosome partitioning protein